LVDLHEVLIPHHEIEEKQREEKDKCERDPKSWADEIGEKEKTYA